jgi:cytochrome c oxidase cbb3-type subunit 2
MTSWWQKKWWWLVAGAVVLAAAVGAVAVLRSGAIHGPHPIAWGRDTCDKCRMHLSRPGFAGQVIAADGQVAKYDDLGCLLAAAQGDAERAWVEDHGGGGWVPLRDATLVRAEGVETPMASGIVAFAGADRARAFAAEHRGEVVTLAALGGERPAAVAAAPGAKRPFSDEDVAKGRPIYVRECSSCHGERGAGDGPAASFLDPRPRDFTKGMFKLRTTASMQPPTTADVLRVIERGIPGTAMPSFGFLSPEERRLAAAWVLDRAGLREELEPAPLPDPGEPPPASEAVLARGRELYADLGCKSCHGAAGKGDGSAASDLRDSDGAPIRVRDFTSGVFRGGDDPRDLYHRFAGGMTGTPMPAFGDGVPPADAWAVVHFVLSLRAPPAERPLSDDPAEAGRAVADKYSCRGCHVLDDGRGGDVGPNLRVSGKKLDSEWVRAFLSRPRAAGKIYPWRPWRMPDLGLAPAEVDAMVRYLAWMGGREVGPVRPPDHATLAQADLAEGKTIFLLRCTECHTLGDVIQTPLAKQQGPDLIRVSDRVDYDWARAWILDPRAVDPRTRMTVPGITEAQADAVRAFVWATALEQQARSASR